MNLADLLRSSYENQSEFKSNLEKKKSGTYDDNLSSMNSKVFLDNNGTPTIVHRGTSNVRDVISDGMYLLGLESFDPRFRNAKKLNKDVEKKYGMKPVNLGHSIGSAVAEYSAPKDGKVITYNKATRGQSIGQKIPKNQTDYRASNDFISVLGKTQRYNNNNYHQVNSGTNDAFVSHKIRHLKNIPFI
jgi:hypothetical protein